MDEHVAEERAHEEQRRRARIGDADRSCFVRAAEVAGHDREGCARRAVLGAGREGEHDRRAGAIMQLHGDVLSDGR